jgi:hypothetical protein
MNAAIDCCGRDGGRGKSGGMNIYTPLWYHDGLAPMAAMMRLLRVA